jgi:hypothetical protein
MVGHMFHSQLLTPKDRFDPIDTARLKPELQTSHRHLLHPAPSVLPLSLLKLPPCPSQAFAPSTPAQPSTSNSATLTSLPPNAPSAKLSQKSALGFPTPTGRTSTTLTLSPLISTKPSPRMASWASTCRQRTVAPISELRKRQSWSRQIAESGAAYAGASAVHMNIFGLEPVRKFGN